MWSIRVGGWLVEASGLGRRNGAMRLAVGDSMALLSCDGELVECSIMVLDALNDVTADVEFRCRLVGMVATGLDWRRSKLTALSRIL